MRLGFARPLAVWLARSPLGRRFVTVALQEGLADVALCMHHVGKHFNIHASLDQMAPWQPDRISGFEDLAWLFSLLPVNRGVLRLDLDEAAYLYKATRSLPARSRCVEIGRYKGGSTVLMAAALPEGSCLLSIDNHSKMNLPEVGPRLDAALRKVLDRYGLASRVELLVADSAQVPVGAASVDLVFVDGDHTYQGVSRDFSHWGPALKVGGHILFHDAAKSRPYATGDPGCLRLMGELARDGRGFRKVAEVGSLAHLMREGS